MVLPDPDFYIGTYMKKRSEPSKYRFPGEDEHKRIFPIYTPIMSLNRIFGACGGTHKCMYDYELLEKALDKAGFDSISQQSFMEGDDAELLIDLKERSHESFYVEAIA
ncbi:hypothetical protein L21SP4_02295 [Kiritimatiella glycovorans]|uniref:Uncharacterized protein n=1 Tax=Kiritimatiella glycovorans TaxID=1307763 RepID=A0A0G3EJA8_9BACT|nr:hypothetical protein L21SP4_02295 [Kiritimatiella glycovorans]